MEPETDIGMMQTWKRLFLRGLAALLPTLVTIIILIKLVTFVNDSFGSYTSFGLTYTYAKISTIAGRPFPSPGAIDSYVAENGGSRDEAVRLLIEQTAGSWQLAIVGFLVAIVIVCIIGLLLASLVGRRLWRMLENTLTQLPVVKQIYPHVKQVTDYVFGEKRMEFSQVVAVQYPRKGVWSVGFVTGPAIGPVRDVNSDYITVFMPSSPTPLTGYVVAVLKEDTLNLPITIEQAFKFIISGGVITPGRDMPGPKAKGRIDVDNDG